MYNYKELREKALDFNSTTEDRLDLFRWMEQYDRRSWNGESFDIDEGLWLFPVYEILEDECGEIEEVILIDAEVR